MRRTFAIVLASSTIASVAIADGLESQNLGEGYSLVVDRGALSVVKGKQRARLGEAVSILDAKLDKKTKKVDVSVGDYTCVGEATYHWSLGYFDARLENTAAYQLHKKKDYKAAAAGFARAVAADPTWTIPAYNLASANQLAGDKDAAIKALAPWIASAPIATYLQVAVDPELTPLMDRPELKALRSTTAGTASLDKAGELPVAYSKDKGLIALTRNEASWGACVYTTELELRDAKTGVLVAHTAVIGWSETSPECDEKTNGVLPRSRAAVAKRIKMLSAVLAELGFVKAKVEKGVVDTSNNKQLARFPKAKLGIGLSQGTVRLLAKDVTLGTAPGLELVRQAVLVDEPKLALVWTLRPGREGCEGTDPTDVAVIPYAPPAGKP